MNDEIVLAQTDTTVGFLSKNIESIYRAKNIKIKKKILINIPKLKDIKGRVSSIHKNRVRRSKRTTFILNNGNSFRIINTGIYGLFLNRHGYFYSSSANMAAKHFNKAFSYQSADIIFRTLTGFSEKKASTIIKLNKSRLIKIR